jgi:hypothetical protein
MVGLQSQSAVVLRLVPPPLPAVSEPQAGPAPEILGEMEAKLREWLHSDHLDGCDSLRGACLEVLNRVNDFLGPYVTEASEGVREFLRMVREAGQADDAGAEEDELGWGAREFLRLAETAQKVIPLRPRV